MTHKSRRVSLGAMQNPVRGFLHGSAALASVIGAALLWSRGAGDLGRQLALLVFGLSLVSLFTASALYHSVPWRGEWKGHLQRVDHSMIYVLVAGTYTPIAFVVFDGWLRGAILAMAWGIAWVGIAQKALLPQLRGWFSVTLQTTQGWIALALVVPLARRLPVEAVLLVALGGVFYTLGMLAFVSRRPRLWPRVFSHHEVFHVLVVAGSAVHYAVMFGWVARFPGSGLP